MTIKKTLYCLLVIVALLMTACASSALPSTTPTPSPAPKKTVTVVVPLQTPTPLPTTPAFTPTPTPIQRVPFLVTRIDMSVSPLSITGTVCGSYIIMTYTAVFHAPDNSTG